VADTFESFGRKVGKFQKELTDDRLMHEIGKMAKAEADRAAKADLGPDGQFSGWPGALSTRYEIVGPGRLSFKPSNARAAGKITVAELGRNASAGPRLRSSSLTVTGRRRSARSIRRWNGVTQGKGTASDALAAIEPKVPKIVDQRIGRAIRKTF
jgi:hypothetical protein